MKILMSTVGALLLAGSLKAAAPVFSPFGTLEGGFESNVYQSPDTFTGTPAPVQDDVFLRTEAGADLAWRFPGQRRVNVSFAHEEIRFSSHTRMNRYGTDLLAEYRHPLNDRWQISAAGYWESRRERGVDVDGLPLSQTYAYTAYELSPRVEWKGDLFSDRGATEFRITFTHREADYETPVSTQVQTQDYSQNEFGLRFLQNYSDQSAAWLDYEMEARDYDKYLARVGGPAALEGDPAPDGTLRTHTDHHLTLAWETRPRPGARWETGLTVSVRDDGYQNYFGYKQYGVYVKGKHRFEGKTELSGKISYAFRRYEVQTLSLADGTKRQVRLPRATVKVAQPLGQRWKVHARYDFDSQDSNVNSPASPLQGFTDHILSAGVTFDW